MKSIARLLFAFIVVCAAAISPAVAQTSSAQIAGNWQGTLIVQGTKLGVVLKITQSSTGQLTGTLDLPDAGANNLPIERLAYAIAF